MLTRQFRDGDIVRCQADSTLYLIDAQTRRLIPSDVFTTVGFSSAITDPTCVLLNTLPLGNPVRGWSEGTVVQDCVGNRYQIEAGQRRRLPSDIDLRQFNDVNLDPALCRYVQSIPEGPPIRPSILQNGMVVRCQQGTTLIPANSIFIISNSRRRWFPSLIEYQSYGSPTFTDVDCTLLARIPPGPNLEPLIDGEVIRCNQTGAIYRIDSTSAGVVRRHYPNFEVYQSHGSPQYNDLECDVVNIIPEGPPLEVVTQPIVLTPTLVPLQQPSLPQPKQSPPQPTEVMDVEPLITLGSEFVSMDWSEVQPDPDEFLVYQGPNYTGWGLRLPGPTIVPDIQRFGIPQFESVKIGSNLRADIFASPDTIDFTEEVVGNRQQVPVSRSIAVMSTQPPMGIQRLYETVCGSPGAFFLIILLVLGILLLILIFWRHRNVN